MKRESILIGDNLRLESTSEGAKYKCSCGQDLGAEQTNFKDRCKLREAPIYSIGTGYTSSDDDMASKMCFREFFCPKCGIRLTTEVARVGDPYLWDVQPRLGESQGEGIDDDSK